MRKTKAIVAPPPKHFHNITDSSRKHNKNKRKKSKPKKIQHAEKCPMRVIELSCPTKRHCLETWKARNKTLPIYMIDRLRKIINDKKPKSQVRDAREIFRKSKIRRRKRNINGITGNRRQEHIKLLCCYFSYKIMDILDKPMHIELSSDLGRIAYIVDEEISGMLYNIEYQRSTEDTEIHNDIIKKVTVWIDGILEESSHNLFLEILREIEAEQRPVLDILNEVFYKASVIFGSNDVSQIPEHVNEYDETTVYIPKQSSDETFKDTINDKGLKLPNQYVHTTLMNNTASDEQGLIYEIFLNAMNNVDDTTEVEDITEIDKSTDLKNIDLKSLKEYINIILIQIIEEAYANIDKGNENNAQDNSDDDDVKFDKSFKRTKDSLVIRSALDLVSKSEMNLNNTVNQDEEDSDSQTPDDENKKVKFNNKDLDNILELANRKASHLSTENQLPIFKTRSVTINNDKSSKRIYLSNPSPFLLSEADESWPESTSFHKTGSLIKVSKSVMSLGKLLEREEEILPQSIKGSKIRNHALGSINKVNDGTNDKRQSLEK